MQGKTCQHSSTRCATLLLKVCERRSHMLADGEGWGGEGQVCKLQQSQQGQNYFAACCLKRVYMQQERCSGHSKVTQSVPSRTALAFDAQARRKPASVSSVTTCNGIFEIRLGSKVQFRFEVAAVTRPVRRDLWHDSAHSQV